MEQDEIQILLDEIAEDYLSRRAKGADPSPEEYVDRHPEIGQRIIDLIRTLKFVDGLKSESLDSRSVFVRKSSHQDSGSTPEIEDFEIIRMAGQGGMGVVYEAEQLSLSRRVALKVLPENHFHDRSAVDRFRLEAKAAAGLHHSNIVPVFDVGVGLGSGGTEGVVEVDPGAGGGEGRRQHDHYIAFGLLR